MFEMRQVASGLGFGEGPVALATGQVLTVDATTGSILEIDPSTGVISQFADVGGGPVGLALAPGGRLLVANTRGMCWETDRNGFLVIAPGIPDDPATPGIYSLPLDGERKPELLYATFGGGQPLLSPNDLILDAHGGFYFTDAGRTTGRVTDPGGLYYAAINGSGIRELIHSPAPQIPLNQPNGVALSPDGDRLYVAETFSGRLWAWDVIGPGQLDLSATPDSPNGATLVYQAPTHVGFDSIAVDSAGCVCVATLLAGGITVVRPDGALDAFIPLATFDPSVTNICFGGPDLMTAYVTTAGHGTLWQINWPRPGAALN